MGSHNSLAALAGDSAPLKAGLVKQKGVPTFTVRSPWGLEEKPDTCVLEAFLSKPVHTSIQDPVNSHHMCPPGPAPEVILLLRSTTQHLPVCWGQQLVL